MGDFPANHAWCVYHQQSLHDAGGSSGNDKRTNWTLPIEGSCLRILCFHSNATSTGDFLIIVNPRMIPTLQFVLLWNRIFANHQIDSKVKLPLSKCRSHQIRWDQINVPLLNPEISLQALMWSGAVRGGCWPTSGGCGSERSPGHRIRGFWTILLECIFSLVESPHLVLITPYKIIQVHSRPHCFCACLTNQSVQSFSHLYVCDCICHLAWWS